LGSGDFVSRGFWLSFFALSGALAVFLAAYPSFDTLVAAWFFDPNTASFPLAADPDWNIVRRVANWLPFLLLLPAGVALVRKLVYPSDRILIAPSVILFLAGSLLLGPVLTSNLLLKENWGRPRPHKLQQFAGTADFQPWWRPGACERNCSFVSGEASLAFWTVAPAALAPPQVRPFAVGGAIVFGTTVGALRVAFGRHFVSDIVFAALITIAIVLAFYRALLDLLRRNDARLERGLEGVSIALHRWIGALLGAAGGALAEAGSSLRSTGQHLHKRVACL
jgi:membrane-associated PAP2 superfamily phosphatase